jgi:hypothetical protein
LSLRDAQAVFSCMVFCLKRRVIDCRFERRTSALS